MPNRTTLLAIAVLCVVGCDIVGCDMVGIDAPIGTPFELEERKAMCGTWLTEDSTPVEVQLSRQGQLSAAWMEWDEKQAKFSVAQFRLDMRRVGDEAYVFINSSVEATPDAEDAKPDDIILPYLFYRMSHSDQELTLQSPKADAFRQSVENGLVDGKIITGESDRFDVLLTSKSKVTKEFFASPAANHFHTKASEDGSLNLKLRHIRREQDSSESASTPSRDSSVASEPES